MKDRNYKLYGIPPGVVADINFASLKATEQTSPCTGCQKFSCQEHPDFQKEVEMCLGVAADDEQKKIFDRFNADVKTWVAYVLSLLKPVEMAEFQKKGCPFS